jgi:transposase InsO family protein
MVEPRAILLRDGEELFRSHRARGGAWIEAASRSWLQLHVRLSGDFQDEIEFLGIEASPSFVREPQGNGVAERFIRTLKENLLWVRTFDTIQELRAALVAFLLATKPGSSPGTAIGTS